MTKKILVVDDSALMRRVLSDILVYDKRFVLEDSATNGLEAYDLIVSNPSKYDLLILDINMPKMNGIQLMEKMVEKKIKIPVLIVSTLALEGAAETLRCLELGAFDFITKPDSFVETKSDKFRNKILSFICAALSLSTENYDTTESAKQPAAPVKTSTSTQTPVIGRKPVEDISKTDSAQKSQIVRPIDMSNSPMSLVKPNSFTRIPHKSVGAGANKLVAIACSTGGPKALQLVIPKLPANLAAPVLLVQHMPEGFTGQLAARLDNLSAISVKEAEHDEVIKRGTVYLAKGGKHMRLLKAGRDYKISLDDDPARNGLRPCADIMYEAIKELDFEEIICVVLTGMGSDGTRGIGQLAGIKNTYVIAQDEASSTVYGMPRMIKEAGITDEVVPLESVASAIAKVVGTC